MLDIHHRTFLFGTMDVHSAARGRRLGCPPRKRARCCETSRTIARADAPAASRRSRAAHQTIVVPHHPPCLTCLRTINGAQRTPAYTRPLISTLPAAKLPYTHRQLSRDTIVVSLTECIARRLTRWLVLGTPWVRTVAGDGGQTGRHEWTKSSNACILGGVSAYPRPSVLPETCTFCACAAPQAGSCAQPCGVVPQSGKARARRST